MEEKTKKVLSDVNQIILEAITYQQTNEQWFLDFLDKLNK